MNLGTSLIGLLLLFLITGPIIYFIVKSKVENKIIQRKIANLSNSNHIELKECYSFKNHHFVIDDSNKKILYIEFNKGNLERHLILDAESTKCCELNIDSYKGPSKTDVIRKIYIVVEDADSKRQDILLYTEKDGDTLAALDTKKDAQRVIQKINSLL